MTSKERYKKHKPTILIYLNNKAIACVDSKRIKHISEDIFEVTGSIKFGGDQDDLDLYKAFVTQKNVALKTSSLHDYMLFLYESVKVYNLEYQINNKCIVLFKVNKPPIVEWYME